MQCSFVIAGGFRVVSATWNDSHPARHLLPARNVEDDAVKRITIIAALALAIACKVEKTGQDTYKVIAPTPEAKAAAQRAAEKARQTAHDASVAIAKKTETSSTSSTETTATTATTTNGTTETTATVETKKKHH